jgi:hypothetical protein
MGVDRVANSRFAPQQVRRRLTIDQPFSREMPLLGPRQASQSSGSCRTAVATRDPAAAAAFSLEVGAGSRDHTGRGGDSCE